WVTDGTSLGTSEITVPGVPPFGITPIYLTVFGSEVLFAGEDAGGHVDLWVTNGTSAGTTEISVGVNTIHNAGSSPQFGVFGGDAFFPGPEGAGSSGLWVTDGTAAGTSEISVTGVYSGGLFALFPPGPDFATLGNKLLFEGEDSRPDPALWVTD